MADSSRHALYAVAESTYGTTPTTSPTFARVRHTSCGLATTKETFQSEEARADRQIADFRHGAKSVAGDVGFELSYGGFFDTMFEAALGGTWTADVLKAGVTRRYFSFLRHFSDLDGADKPYHLFPGCEVNTMNLSIPANGMVTGSFGLMGKGPQGITADLSALTTPTLGDPTTVSPFDAFSGALTEGGVTIATISQLDLSLDNGLTTRYVVGSTFTIFPDIGRSNLTGTVTAFFEDAALLEKFINETESSLTLTLTDLDGNDYEIAIPRLKYNGGPLDTSGVGSISIALPFQALYDDTEETNITITRTDAV